MLKTFKARLIKKQRLTEDIYLFRFQPISTSLNFIPGQYLGLVINGKIRLYSLSSSIFDKDGFEIIAKFVPEGLGSQFLNKLKINELVDFFGPAGRFSLNLSHSQKVFWATGVGITPFLSMIFSYYDPKSQFTPQITLFWGLRFHKDLFFYKKLLGVAKSSKGKFSFWLCFSRERNRRLKNNHYFYGRIQNIYEEFFFTLANGDKSEFYLCGSREVVEDMRIYLLKHKISSSNIFFEKF